MLAVFYHHRVYLSTRIRIILGIDNNEGGDRMIVDSLAVLGAKLYAVRKKYGMTQAQAAEAAGLSNNTYAEIERGVVNTSIESIMQICRALHITPDEILTERGGETTAREEDILARLHACNPKDKETALRILDAYLQSLT